MAGCSPHGEVSVAVWDASTLKPISGAKVEVNYGLPMFSQVYAPHLEKLTGMDGIVKLDVNLSGGSEWTIFGKESFGGPDFIAGADGYLAGGEMVWAARLQEIRHSKLSVDKRPPDIIIRLTRRLSD